VVESSKVSQQQQRNDEQQCPSCAAELTEASVWMIAASESWQNSTYTQTPIWVFIDMGIIKQDAQLSHRETALQGVIFLAKGGRLELGDNILRTL